MLIFLYLFFAMGVAYAAKRSARHPAWWFLLSVALTPLIGSIALVMVNRYGIRRI
jgi:hypothetical protein